MSQSIISQVQVVTPPTLEPISLDEAKTHLFIATSEMIHDTKLQLTIQAAREQWESDTDSAVLTQTLRVTSENFGSGVYGSFSLPRRPIQSISSVTYYDAAGTSTTLATSVYALDAQSRTIRLKPYQNWPTSQDRWDAITITYIAGYTTPQLVPAIAKQAILLLCGYYFEKNRGDNDGANDMRAYEALVLRYMRSTYP